MLSSGGEVMRRERELRSMHETLRMTVAIPFLFGVPPAYEMLRCSERPTTLPFCTIACNHCMPTHRFPSPCIWYSVLHRVRAVSATDVWLHGETLPRYSSRLYHNCRGVNLLVSRAAMLSGSAEASSIGCRVNGRCTDCPLMRYWHCFKTAVNRYLESTCSGRWCSFAALSKASL